MALTLNKDIRLDLSTVSSSAGAGPLWQNHPIVRAVGGSVLVQEHNEIRYDTPTLQLYRSRVALTLNRRGEQWIQRCSVEEGAEQDKKWLETSVPDQQVDLKMMRKMPAFPPLNATDARSLAPVFTLHCREQKCSLSFPGGLAIILKEEQGYIKWGATRQSFHELVFEYQAGDLARWFQTVLELAYGLFLHEKGGDEKNGPLEQGGPGLVGATPVTRGFAWLDPALLMPVVRTTPEGKSDGPPEEGMPEIPLPKGASERTARQAFVVLCAGLLQAMQVDQTTVLYGGKQARLAGVRLFHQAVGRLRTLIGWYQTVLPAAIYTELDKEIGWLLKELVLVQECQMLLKETLEPLTEQFATHPGLEELLLKTKNGLIHALKRLEKALTSFRYTRLILGLESWITGSQWEFLSDHAQRETLALPMARLAADWLQQCHAPLRKRGRQWSGLDGAARGVLYHEMEQMLYTMDLFADLFAGKRTESGGRTRPTGGRNAFQESLSRVHSVAQILVHLQTGHRLLTRGGNAKEGGANHPIQVWQEARMARCLADATQEWELFSTKLSFWH